MRNAAGHGIPDGYPLKEGDIVNVDVTVYHNGYHADLNETHVPKLFENPLAKMRGSSTNLSSTFILLVAT